MVNLEKEVVAKECDRRKGWPMLGKKTPIDKEFSSIHQHTYYILIPSIYTNPLNITKPAKHQPNAVKPVKLYHVNSCPTNS